MQGEKVQKGQVFSIMSVSVVQLNPNLHLNTFLEALYLLHILPLDFTHFGKFHIKEDAF